MIETLCWNCKNAVPNEKVGCPWSKRFEPVKGWIADKHLKQGRISYTVLSCPLYEMDDDKTIIYTDDNSPFKALGFSIATQCVTDYRNAYKLYLLHKGAYETSKPIYEEYNRLRYWYYGAKSRYKQQSGNDEVSAFLTEIYFKVKQTYKTDVKIVEEGFRVKHDIKECEWFFETEEFLNYTDMDGRRIMNMVRDQVREEIREEQDDRKEIREETGAESADSSLPE